MQKQNTRRYLLDVNVLIALLDDDHIHNQLAWQILKSGIAIASCPLTENGAMRILNLPGYSQKFKSPGILAVRNGLQSLFKDHEHQFWADDISLVADSDCVDFSRAVGHNQLTDAYLLALCVKHEGTLLTFDQRIALSAVRGARTEHLHLI